jgi:hypothetical protein
MMIWNKLETRFIISPVSLNSQSCQSKKVTLLFPVKSLATCKINYLKIFRLNIIHYNIYIKIKKLIAKYYHTITHQMCYTFYFHTCFIFCTQY